MTEYEAVPMEVVSNPSTATNGITQTHPFLDAAKEGKWREALNYIDSRVEAFQEITLALDDNGKNILHLACELLNHERAVEYAEHIIELDYSDKTPSIMITFINTRDKTDRTPLHIAIMKENTGLVELLLDHGADMNATMPQSTSKEALGEIYGRLPQVMVKLYDNKLNVEMDKRDPDDDWSQWVHHDFSPIIGRKLENYEEFELHETYNLSQILRHVNEPQSRRILSHPLVQLFLHYKNQKYKKWILLSIFVHIIWNTLSCAFILYNAHFPYQNDTIIKDCMPFEPRESCNNAQINNAYFIVMFTLLLIMTIKEVVEAKTCPDNRFYRSQIENWGQFLLIVLVSLVFIHAVFIPQSSNNIVVWLFNHLMIVVYLFGSLFALTLIQGQISKLPTMAIYREMFIKAFKQICKLLLSFLPLLLGFMITFHIIMPKEGSKFEWSNALGLNKILTMMIGEFEYDDDYKWDNFTDSQIRFWSAYIAFFFFVLLVVILLQNLLIGLTVSDVKELHDNAKESYLASRLEDIYLIENFFTSDFVHSHWKPDLNVGENNKMRLYCLPAELRNTILQWADVIRMREREKEKENQFTQTNT